MSNVTKKPENHFAAIDAALKCIYAKESREKICKKLGWQISNYASYVRGKPLLSPLGLKSLISKIYNLAFEDGKMAAITENLKNFSDAYESFHGKDSLRIRKKRKKCITKKEYREKLENHTTRIFNPIFEFEKVCPKCTASVRKKKNSWNIDSDDDRCKEIENKLKKEGERKRVGVYAMYDSAGRIIYFGMTNAMGGLYGEIKNRLDAQLYRCITLPDARGNLCKRNMKNLPTSTKKKKGKVKCDWADEIRVGDLTCYISAIEVLVPKAIKKAISNR